jgi:phage baseplate assembly protein W
MATVTAYQLSLSGATWVDVNTLVSIDPLPDRLPDQLSITNSSLRNLFNCPIGARGKIFQPEYGSEWYQMLEEPIDDLTAAKMVIVMIQAIARWEPRIVLDYSQSFVKADLNLPGYYVRVAGIDSLTKQPISATWAEVITP